MIQEVNSAHINFKHINGNTTTQVLKAKHERPYRIRTYHNTEKIPPKRIKLEKHHKIDLHSQGVMSLLAHCLA